MKKNKVKEHFLEQLRRVPIVQVACEKCGISRNSVYRWKNTDKEFFKAMEEAIAEGEALVNDMGESQLLSLIREKNWPAISFWLRHRNPKFRDKVEITTRTEDVELTPEQESIVRRALGLASSVPQINKDNINQHETRQNDTPGISGNNDQGSENKGSDNEKKS